MKITGFSESEVVNYSNYKRVLITGEHSYIGESFEKYATQNYPSDFEIETIDLIDGQWRKKDFSSFDIVFHVAGIAHADVGNVSEEVKKKYYEVNTDLAIDVAKKAKENGVKQFVFMSSMIVYGDSAKYGQKRLITKDTIPVPSNFYGDSKWQADKGIRELSSDNFNVTVLRPPMIYGRGSKGNYPMLAKLAKKLPVFPKIDNERSMLHIDNLCEFLCQVMLIGKGGIYFPQNKEYTNTANMVEEIAKVAGKHIYKLKILNPFVWLCSKIPGKISGMVNKAFGNMVYDKSMSEYPEITYHVIDFRESILQTETQEVKESSKEHPKALILASVASMIDLFNRDNINILLKLGYDVEVATNFEFGSITSSKRVNEYKQELIDKGIKVYNIPIPRNINMIKEIISSYRMLKKLVNKREYAVVHCHSPIGGVICRLACKNVRKKYATKVIYTAHGFHFFKGASKKNWMLFYPTEYFCSYYTDVLITINKEDYNSAKKFHAKKVEYVPGIGIHTNEFRNISINRNKLREEFGFSDDDFIFMSTGQISVRKNHEVIIRALAKIDNSKVKYLIVGFGELETKLKKLVSELELNSRVVFAGYRDDVKEILHVVDAYAFPSLQEGLPASLMEAMSVGLPVVCSRIRGNVDLIENGKGGLIYDCKDIEGFAEGMKKISEGLGNEMGINNIETMKKFDASVVNEIMEKIYREV